MPILALIRRVTLKPVVRLALVKVVPSFTSAPPILTFIVFTNTIYVAPEKPAGGVQVACTLLLLICLNTKLVGGSGSVVVVLIIINIIKY